MCIRDSGLYEYFYQMKYGEKFTAEKEVVGIPAEEFENVIMTYLPVTKEELKEWAVYDEQSNMFIWERLGCGNYSPTHFGLSLPEVTEVRHNEDGTIVLTIHAVCDSVVCNDAVITHELTMKIQDDGTIPVSYTHLILIIFILQRQLLKLVVRIL